MTVFRFFFKKRLDKRAQLPTFEVAPPMPWLCKRIICNTLWYDEKIDKNLCKYYLLESDGSKWTIVYCSTSEEEANSELAKRGGKDIGLIPFINSAF